MPSHSLMRGFLFLWVITGAVLFIGSIDTMLIAGGSSADHNPHIFVLGAEEAVAAVLFILIHGPLTREQLQGAFH